MDINTYCSFKSRCSCRSGQTCATPSIRTCTDSSGCNSTNEYCGNGRCQVVKDLYESCETSDQCEVNALCSPSTKKCICQSGYKLSPVKMTCIPEGYCSNNLDCEHGYCDTETSTCIPGVKLSGRCTVTKQCQAYDVNSYCDGDTNQCTCGLGYYVSSQGICLLDGKCRINDDCRQDANGLCYYEECIYTKKLSLPCKESRQCYLETPYSYCETTDQRSGQAQCSCLNGYQNYDDNDKDDDNDDNDDNQPPPSNANCKQWRDCNTNKDCSNIINSHCDHSHARCSCNTGYNLNVDGYCYKKSLSPTSDKGQLILDRI